MTIDYTTQYQPLSTRETATGDALSVRAIRDLAASINNAYARVLAPVLTDAWPGGQLTAASSSSERVAFVLAPVFVGKREQCLISVCGQAIDATYTTTIRVYCAQRLFRSATWNALTDADRVVLGYPARDRAEVAFSSTTISTESDWLYIAPDTNGMAWLVVTSQSSASHANGRARLYSMTLQACHS